MPYDEQCIYHQALSCNLGTSKISVVTVNFFQKSLNVIVLTLNLENIEFSECWYFPKLGRKAMLALINYAKSICRMLHQSRKLLHDTGFFLYPWKTSESPWFSDVLREYRKRPVEWNGLRSGESYSVDKMHGNPVNRWSGAEIFSNFPVIRMLIYRWSFAALLFCGKSQVFSI